MHVLPPPLRGKYEKWHSQKLQKVHHVIPKTKKHIYVQKEMKEEEKEEEEEEEKEEEIANKGS